MNIEARKGRGGMGERGRNRIFSVNLRHFMIFGECSGGFWKRRNVWCLERARNGNVTHLFSLCFIVQSYWLELGISDFRVELKCSIKLCNARLRVI